MFNLEGMTLWDLVFSYRTTVFQLTENKYILTAQERNYFSALKREIEIELYKKHYFPI